MSSIHHLAHARIGAGLDFQQTKRRAIAHPRRHNGRKALAVVGAVGMASAVLSACGSSGNAMKNIQKSKSLTVAISAFPPQDYQSSNGQWTGYDVDILRGYAKSIGAKLKITSMPLAAAVEAVSTHSADMTIDIYYTPQRAKAIGFSRPMLNYNDAIAVNSSHPGVKAATVKALTGKSVAVVSGSAEVAEAQKVPHANVQQFSDITDSFLAISQGRVDGDFQPDVDISWAKHKNPSLHMKLLGAVPASLAPPIQELRGYYGLPKGSYGKAFTTSLNAYLKKIACDGTEQQILNKYGMKEPVYLKGICQATDSPTSS